MKFGLCTSPDKAAQLKPGTLDYIEMNLSNVQKMTSEELAAAKKILEEIGIPAEASNGFFPGEVRLCGKNYNPETVREYTERALNNAAYLGIHTCVLGSSKARNIEEGDDRDTCLAQFEEALVIAGDVAKKYGTTVVLEPLNVKEANYLNTVSEGAAICRRVNHPNVMLLADYYHVAYANEPMSIFTENADILRHMHIADPANRKYPLPTDGADYSPLAKALKESGYNFRMSIEGGCSGEFVESAETAIAYLRQLFA